MGKRGRPVLAAKSIDEALRAVELGTAPKRARNEFERVAGGKTRGRRPAANSKTRIAAELAAYFVKAYGLPQADAIRQARNTMTPAPDASNVRRYLKRMNPTVESAYKGQFPGFAGLMPSQQVPLLYSVSDAE